MNRDEKVVQWSLPLVCCEGGVIVRILGGFQKELEVSCPYVV